VRALRKQFSELFLASSGEAGTVAKQRFKSLTQKQENIFFIQSFRLMHTSLRDDSFVAIPYRNIHAYGTIWGERLEILAF